jgi:hypothetical protein
MEKTAMPERVQVNAKSNELVEEGYPNSVEYVRGDLYQQAIEDNKVLKQRNAELSRMLSERPERLHNDDINY